ncbi:MAG TPA: cytochrome P450 [Bacteriovoracaceae bacterium]|nr:cytochrome P450 [Bacteriovoracaceae bacterium]
MESLRNLKTFTSNPLLFLDQQFASNPAPVQSLRIGHKKFHLVFDPSTAGDVLASRHDLFVQNRTIFDRIKPITGDKGLVQLAGTQSQRERKKVRPMLLPSNLESMNGQIRSNTEEALGELVCGQQVDIMAVMADLVLKNAFSVFLGLDLKESARDIVSGFRELNELCGKRMVALAPLPLFLPVPANLRIRSLRNSLRTKILLALRDSRPAATNVHKIFMDSEFLIDQCMTFLFAGHETTASSLAFTLLLLGSHPRYRDEIAGGADESALRVYKEALRLYPPAYMLAREAAVDTNLGTCSVRRGDQVLIGVSQIHRHPDFHQRPSEFDPQRFSQPVKAFLPFGLGAKSCIGEKLAYLEAVTIIKIFCQKFRFQTLEKEIRSFPLVTLHPRPGQYLKLEGVARG